MAQLVEQRIRNAQAVGSSPTISSTPCESLRSAGAFFILESKKRLFESPNNIDLFIFICIKPED